MTIRDQNVPGRRVLILAYAGTQIIDIAGPAQVLAEANLEGAVPRYDVSLVSAAADAVPTSSGLVLAAGPIPLPATCTR